MSGTIRMQIANPQDLFYKMRLFYADSCTCMHFCTVVAEANLLYCGYSNIWRQC